MVFIIQHFLKWNSAPDVDCRPPVMEEGSVKHSGVYPPGVSLGFIRCMTARRFIFIFISLKSSGSMPLFCLECIINFYIVLDKTSFVCYNIFCKYKI